MLNGIQVVQPGQTRQRFTRTPNFGLEGGMKPSGLYPLMCAAVLPGETLEHASLKLTQVSKPIVHPLAGAWSEGWLFYVKFSDIDRDLGEMFITDEADSTAYQAVADAARFFVKAGQVDWLRLCYNRIAECYFLNEGETARSIDGVNQTKLQNIWWGQNLMFQEDVPDTTLPDTSGAAGEAISAYDMMRMMGMTELSYEEYLKQYGVQSVRTEQGWPEMLRYWRSWTKPNNSVEPTTGTPSSAWYWNQEVKADKSIYFKEPGFLVALQAIRPKMYLGNYGGSVVGNLWGFSSWFPAYTLRDPSAGIKTISTANPSFAAASRTDAAEKDMLVDMRDVLNHGEQFRNGGAAPQAPVASAPMMNDASPIEDLRGEYATPADIDNLFVGETPDTQTVYYEGLMSLRIRGHVTDTTK